MAFLYFSYSVIQGKIENKQVAEQSRSQALEEAALLRSFAQRHGADVTWPDKLVDGEFRRRSPIMTVELQDIWLNDRPLLFLGNVIDIVRKNGEGYLMIVEYSAVRFIDNFPATQIAVHLDCEAEIAYKMLEMVREMPRRTSLFPSVALVIVVKSVSSEVIQTSYGDIQTRLIGHGSCISGMPVRRSLPRDWFDVTGSQ